MVCYVIECISFLLLLNDQEDVWLCTIIFLSFRTDRSGQTVQTQIAVWSGSTLFAIPSALKSMFWMHYSKTANFQVSEILGYWAAPSEFGTYRLCEQRRFRRACASAQSRQNLRCSLIQAVNQEEPSDRKPDPWPLWMAGHAQLKFVVTECSKTQIRLGGSFMVSNRRNNPDHATWR